MRTSCVLAAVGLLLVPACRAASSAKVIAAAATSSSPGAATAICLLKTDCTGWWSPGSLDSGANEGIYVQLESTIDADVVEFTTNAKDATRNFNVSVNGALVAAPATTRPISGDEYVARFSFLAVSLRNALGVAVKVERPAPSGTTPGRNRAPSPHPPLRLE